MTDRKRLLGTFLFGAWNPTRWDDVSRKQPRQWLKCHIQLLLLPLDGTHKVRSTRRFGWFWTNSHRWNTNRLLSFAFRSIHADYRERRRSQYLRAGLQLLGKWTCLQYDGQSSEAGGVLRVFSRIHNISIDWWGNWKWIRNIDWREHRRWIRKKLSSRVQHFPITQVNKQTLCIHLIHCFLLQDFTNHGSALQRVAVNSLQHGLLRRLHSSWQRGHLWRVRHEFRTLQSRLHKSQSYHQPGRFKLYRFMALFRFFERWHEGASNQSCTLSENSFSFVFLCSDCTDKQRISCRSVNATNHEFLLSSALTIVQMRSEKRQISMLLFAVSRRCEADGNQSSRSWDQVQEVHPVCWMVTDSF